MTEEERPPSDGQEPQTVHVGGKLHASGGLVGPIRVGREAESWQFLAFIFGAVVLALFTLIDDFVTNTWCKLGLQVVSFVGAFYFTMLNSKVVNWLIGVLNNVIKKPK
jgi:hypothetical protein